MKTVRAVVASGLANWRHDQNDCCREIPLEVTHREDELPDGALNVDGQGVSISKDGTIIVTGASDDRRVFQLQNNKFAEIPQSDFEGTSVAMSYSGKYIAFINNNEANGAISVFEETCGNLARER